MVILKQAVTKGTIITMMFSSGCSIQLNLPSQSPYSKVVWANNAIQEKFSIINTKWIYESSV